jgi:DNA repair protein RadD
MSEIKLRDYQNIAKNKSVKWHFNSSGKNGLLCAITGVGKTLIIAGIIKDILMQNPRTRVIVLTSTKELVAQDEDGLLRLWKTAPTAVYCAGLKRKELGQITFATIGSMFKKVGELTSIDLLIVDETQTISHKEDTQYRRFITSLKEKNSDMNVIGLTATPYRLSGGHLMDGHIFDDMIIDMTDFKSFKWFFENKYISEPISKKMVTQIDTSKIKMAHGDFKDKDLQDASDKEEITRSAIQEALVYGADRKHWIVFATGIEHTEHITQMLNDEFEIPSTMVHSRMPESERDQNILDFKSGKYRACVNNKVLCVGFDFQAIDLILDLQPTNSTALHQQKYGRSLRIAPKHGMPIDTLEERIDAILHGEKPKGALILDCAGNTSRNGFLNDPIIPSKKGKGGGKQPMKTCVQCETICHPSVRFCPECGTEFAFEVKITEIASSLDIIATKPRSDMKLPKPPEVEPTWYDVTSVSYSKHINRKTGVPMLKVVYNEPYLSAVEWVGFEDAQGTWQRGAAYTWWSKRIIGKSPKTVDEVLSYVSQLPKPKRILVKSSGRYLNVNKVEFDENMVLPTLQEVKVPSFDYDEDNIPF